MLSNMLMKKMITGIAYTLIGSDIVRDSLNKENARKVLAASRRAAASAGRTLTGKGRTLRAAVKARKQELLTREDDGDDSLI